jgi:hypothetical protein
VADEDTPNGGATPPGGPTPTGATPGGQAGAGARPAAGDDDAELRERGKAALDREREARREAEQRASAAEKRLQELEDQGKTEVERAISRLDRQSAELETERGRRAELEARLAASELLELKRSIAQEMGVPLDAAHRLQGTDSRSIRADAQKYLDERGPAPGSVGVGRGGTASGGRGPGVDMNQMIREAAGRTS